MLPNKKRNLHLYIWVENGQESGKSLWKWERIEKKMAGFKNHRFSLRCLDNNIIPVSLRLKSNIWTPRGLNNIKKKTEKALLNEIIRTINNTIEILECQRDTCKIELSRVLDQVVMAECNDLWIRSRKTDIQDPRMEESKTWEAVDEKGPYRQGWPLKECKHAQIHASE